MKIRALLLAATALAALCAPAAPALAQIEPSWAQPQFQGGDRGGPRVMSVREIISAVRSQLGRGDVIGQPSLHNGGGRPFYIVQWRQPDGVIRQVRVDAVNGRVIG